jgi:molybdopterin converting factor small subunit
VNVRVLPFARIREIVGSESLERSIDTGATAGEVWADLAREFPALAPLERSTRLVRNGAFATAATRLADGDELGLLPPFGGG